MEDTTRCCIAICHITKPKIILFFPSWTNFGQTLIFVLLYAKLLPVAKPEKQGLTRVSPISGVSQIPAVFDSRDIRQMDVQAPPHGSLFRGK